MSLGRFFLIELTGIVSASPVSIWLTSDGSGAGVPCKLLLAGADLLLSTRTAVTSSASDGSPFNEKPLTPTGAGRDFDIQISQIPTSRYTAIRDLVNAMIDDASSGGMTADGEPGSIDIDWIPRFAPGQAALSFGSFSPDWVKDVVIRGRTSAIN